VDDGDPNTDTSAAVYTFNGGTLTLHAANDITIDPDTGLVMQELDEPGLSSGNIAFRGYSDDNFNNSSIYTNATGPFTTVVTRNTPVPGFPTYTFTSSCCDLTFNDDLIGIEIRISDGVNDEKILLLSTTSGTLTPIANTINTLSPSSGLVFDGLDVPVPDGANYVFQGGDPNDLNGVYTNLGGSLRVVADENTTVPGRVDTFTGFDGDAYSLEGSRILFEGSFASGRGAYLEDNGTLLKILATGDTFDGKLVSGVDLAMEPAISGNKVAVDVSFDDGSAGIYVLIIPEPCTGILALLGLVMLGICRRQPSRV